MPSKRKLLGVPKAGDLYVNGVKTPKGNVLAQVRKIYQGSNANLLEDGEPAEVILRAASVDELACDWCGEIPARGEHIADGDGRVWHLASGCRRAAVLSDPMT